MPLIATGGDGFYTGFLTPQGRMLYDAFIYPVNVGVNFPHPKFMIELPATATQPMFKHLRRYILRSKVKLRDVSDEFSAFSVWGNIHQHNEEEENKVPTGGLVKKSKRVSDIGCIDPRVPGFGYRAIVPRNEDMGHKLSSLGDFKELSSEEYTIRRILNGIPEGIADMWPEQSLPLESNFDYMNGVDFRKGCYVGQELTIRTYHTGVVRKRILPVQLYDKEESVPTTLKVDREKRYPSDIQPQMDIKLSGSSSKRGVGKTCSGIHNIGLALMRLEQVEKCTKNNDITFEIPDTNVRVRPFLPEWWPVEKQE
ncbi:hypothetical protein BDA99DRAFT_346160 [Phascolomyces articulosus]|uniref:CAF17 C-terminal domain-containing protein n=1 Tax=Phascolomyces articulosus TaxID=60185 RepID=A0AAD5KER6_9FUNG|nr:hypothetical protein BDA99DRAFT_346160 [Phascolomyces articulosus]